MIMMGESIRQIWVKTNWIKPSTFYFCISLAKKKRRKKSDEKKILSPVSTSLSVVAYGGMSILLS